jgi:hypothetical protein
MHVDLGYSRFDSGQSLALIDAPFATPVKLKDITEWSGRWATPVGTMDANAHVEDAVLVDLSL